MQCEYHNRRLSHTLVVLSSVCPPDGLGGLLTGRFHILFLFDGNKSENILRYCSPCSQS